MIQTRKFSSAQHRLLNSNLRSLAGIEPETDVFVKLQPITNDSVKLMNVMANQRHSDKSLLKHNVLFTCSLTELSGEFSHQKKQSSDVHKNVSKILILQCKQLQ